MAPRSITSLIPHATLAAGGAASLAQQLDRRVRPGERHAHVRDAGVRPEIPWHVTAFHQEYRMTEPNNTPPETLVRACEIGAQAGLQFVYAGNLPGRVGRWEHTWCPDCGERLIERSGYVIRDQRVSAAGACPICGRRVPGIWC